MYGEEVNDFHIVDYDALTTLNVSATQAQQKVIEAQQAEINALKEQLNGMKYLKREVASIKKQLNMNETAKK